MACNSSRLAGHFGGSLLQPPIDAPGTEPSAMQATGGRPRGEMEYSQATGAVLILRPDHTSPESTIDF